MTVLLMMSTTLPTMISMLVPDRFGKSVINVMFSLLRRLTLMTLTLMKRHLLLNIPMVLAGLIMLPLALGSVSPHYCHRCLFINLSELVLMKLSMSKYKFLMTIKSHILHKDASCTGWMMMIGLNNMEMVKLLFLMAVITQTFLFGMLSSTTSHLMV